MCDAHDTECIWPVAEQPDQSRQADTSHPHRRTRQAAQVRRRGTKAYQHSVEPCSSSELSPQRGQSNFLSAQESVPSHGSPKDAGPLGDTEDHNEHVIGPVMANDSEILDTYFSAMPEHDGKRRVETASNRQARPVMFTTVPRKPLGTHQCQTVASSKCELIEKMIEPFEKDLVQMYLDKANACVPIFEPGLFMGMYINRKDKISPALLANLYANSMIYWTKSTCRSLEHAPDGRYIWVQAQEALHSETFLSPGTSTVIALILNVSGRPSTSPFNNGGMIGTAVALSHALGLNRDPSKWLISGEEKEMRVRVWWQVLVQDRWCSWSYGTPPQIHSDQYDVPLPTIQTICKSSRSEDHAVAEVSLSLISLSETLGTLLEYVYNVKPTKGKASSRESSMSLETCISLWESNLHGNVEEIIRHGSQLYTPGAANLRLSYLAIRLLLRRIQLDLDKPLVDESDSSLFGHHQFYAVQALQSAEDIAWLVQCLDEEHVRGFWLGHNSASLTSAFSFLLRNTLQSISAGDVTRANTVLNKAIKMMDKLQFLRRNYDWDLADACIAQYSDFVVRLRTIMATGIGSETHNDHQQATVSLPDIGEAIAQLPDLQSAGLDFMFPDLWDIFEA